jgi:hypothetical protein
MGFRRVLLAIILLFLILPFLQNNLRIAQIPKLNGAITYPEDTCFTWGGWFSGSYQKEKETFCNDTFGFRSTCVRLHNQISYSLFSIVPANGILIGKNNFMYEYSYIYSYYGSNFVGEDSINRFVEHLKFMQDTLARLGKTLLLVIAPGKGWYYPEYIPDELKTAKGPTNYEYTLKMAKQLGISFIDFNKYYMDNKYKSPYPLYPQTGIHWSFYGVCLSSDSIIRYIEKLRHIRMPHFFWTHLDIDNARGVDKDIENGLNLLLPFKTFKLAYPHIIYETDSGKTKPNLLTVGDSFFWRDEEIGWPGRCFNLNSFWYYNKEIYSNTPEDRQDPEKVDLKKTIENTDVVLILSTETNLRGCGWGFADRFYKEYKRHS